MKNEKDFKIQALSATIRKATRCLHSAIKYIYTISNDDFYNINVKDLFQLSLSDISNPNILNSLGISSESAAVFNSEEFAKLESLILYTFAVRTPYLRRIKSAKLKDRFIYNLYLSCVEQGATDPDNIVRETFETALKSAKINQPEPPFNGEWFRRWVYSYGAELASINNKNMFLLGCMDALLPLYYAKLSDNLIGLIIQN